MRQHRDNRSAGEMHAARRLVHTVGFGAQRRRKYSERQMRNGRDENVSHQSGGRSSAQEEEQCRGCGEADSCRSPMDDRRRGRRINQQTKNEEEEKKKRKEKKKLSARFNGCNMHLKMAPRSGVIGEFLETCRVLFFASSTW